MSNRELPVEVLLELRKKVVYAVVHHDVKKSMAAKLFGFSLTSVIKYVREFELKGEDSFHYKKRGVKESARCFLSAAQIEGLLKTLLRQAPDDIGLDYTLWNSKAIGAYIEKAFGIKYSGRGLRDLLRRLGFSSQKPIKQAYQRDPNKVTQWLNETYPAIKTRAMQEGARIYWADEMGLQSCDNRGRTYGLVNQTPVIKKTGSRFKVNMLAAISPQGFMNWMVFENNCDSQIFIEFLGRLRRQVKQKVFLIVDNLKVHHSKNVQCYVGKT
ncbi:Transposase and inactivated derivatives [Legionella busanensis]|uniref:Transposase and inactivated derivatives n=1 Tax=Legionella busanensis TaxID=190655 RepID=A0A378KC44_9GAMM|nr:IS630 family transposase [Legionella busanensis]STX81733.1 Transposase and inactivated derivatives [Legionella busanensis]